MAKKVNLGSKLALYPTPVTVIGADVNGKVNWMELSHIGIVSHDRVLVSMAKPHYTTPALGIGKHFSLNLVSPEMLDKVDYVGSVDGDKEDKSEVFEFPTYSYILSGDIIGKCRKMHGNWSNKH